MKNRTKRVLLITSEFPPSPGGIGNHAFSLAQGLSLKSCTVTVLTDAFGSDIKQILAFDAKQSFDVVRVKRHFPFFYVGRVMRAVSLVNSISPDVVLVSGKFSLWIGAWLKLLRRVSVTCVLHGSELNPPGIISRWLTYLSIQRLDRIICVSSFTRQLLPKRLLDSIPNTVIPNAVNISEFENLARESHEQLIGNPALLTIGNVSKRKGQHRVIQALPLISSAFPEVHYHCIGIPTRQSLLQRLADSLCVSNLVTFHGKMARRNAMFDLARTATVFVMLSENQKNGDVEGFGIAILEGNALGLPAIGARGSGIEDAIKENYNGILVDGNNAQELLEALQLIQADYSRFSVNAKEWAKQHDRSMVIEKYTSFIFDKT